MSKTKKTEGEDAAKAQYALDALAYLMLTTGDRLDRWREDRELRAQQREHARDLMYVLEKAGLRVKVSNMALLTKLVDEISTIPARRAYEPGAE